MGVMLEKKLFFSGFAKVFLLFRYKKLKINISILMYLRLQGHF